jgi:hypothetical protein
VSAYFLDWDHRGRAQTVEVLDADTGAVLDTRTVSGFAEGQYLTWDLSGRVQIRVTNLGGVNAVLSGLFFGQGGNALQLAPGAVTGQSVGPAAAPEMRSRQGDARLDSDFGAGKRPTFEKAMPATTAGGYLFEPVAGPGANAPGGAVRAVANTVFRDIACGCPFCSGAALIPSPDGSFE